MWKDIKGDMTESAPLITPYSPGVPNLWAAHPYRSGPVRNWAAQQEVSLKVMRSNYPETITPTRSVEELPTMKPVPGAKKVGNHCLKLIKLY